MSTNMAAVTSAFNRQIGSLSNDDGDGNETGK